MPRQIHDRRAIPADSGRAISIIYADGRFPDRHARGRWVADLRARSTRGAARFYYEQRRCRPDGPVQGSLGRAIHASTARGSLSGCVLHEGRRHTNEYHTAFHHNYYENIGQRAPRVRYGQVHVFNNYDRIASPVYSYTWGVGVESASVAERNFFAVETGVAPARFIRAFSRRPGRPGRFACPART